MGFQGSCCGCNIAVILEALLGLVRFQDQPFLIGRLRFDAKVYRTQIVIGRRSSSSHHDNTDAALGTPASGRVTTRGNKNDWRAFLSHELI